MSKRIILLILFLILTICLGAAVFIFKNKYDDNQKLSETIILRIYFNNSFLDSRGDCGNVFPVERKVSKTVGTVRAALEALLRGPSEEEKNKGYFTSINRGVSINNISLKNGIAYVDFDEQLEFQVGGSCRVAAIRAQIEKTTGQFQTIQKTVISINGRTEDILQP